MNTYALRFRDSRRRVVELNGDNGLPQTLYEALDYAGCLSNARRVDVTVTMNGDVICAVWPAVAASGNPGGGSGKLVSMQEQIEEDTCGEHGVFCCVECFDMSAV